MSRSNHHGCGKGGGCGLCRPEKKWKSNALEDQRPAVRRVLQENPENEEMQSSLMTVPEVAEFLRTTPNAVYLLISRGQLPGVVHLGRRVLVRRTELREHLGLANCTHSS
jgi:excisionase family DNA binding protein